MECSVRLLVRQGYRELAATERKAHTQWHGSTRCQAGRSRCTRDRAPDAGTSRGDRGNDADVSVHGQFANAASSRNESPCITQSRCSHGRQRLHGGLCGPGGACHLSAGMRGELRAEREQPAPGGPDPGCAEPSASFPRTPDRSALPRIPRQADQHRRLRRYRTGKRASPRGGRGRWRPPARCRRAHQSHKRASMARTEDPMVQHARLSGPLRHPG